MRIAIPVVDGELATHFGHCQEFSLFDVDPDTGTVQVSASATAPPHEPGALPRWLKDRGVDMVIAGGMGRRAQAMFAESGVETVLGATPAPPSAVVEQYLSGKLRTGANLCDH